MHKTFFALALLASLTTQASTEIDAYKKSWTANALKLQRSIDLTTPFKEATFLGTHNSINSKAYQIPFRRYVDPNQVLSLYDQLEIGIRSIELDIHWTTSANLTKDLLLCHGQWNHTGCSMWDRHVTEGLKELRDWLEENPGEIVIAYLDRALDGHEPRLAKILDEELGRFIYRPTQVANVSLPPTPTRQPPCQSLPGHLTKADILKAGKQLIIVAKNCDGLYPQHYQETKQFTLPWNHIVFAGIGTTTRNPFDILDSTMNYFTSFPDCAFTTEFYDDPTHNSMWRIFEDRTSLSKIERPQRPLLPNDMKELLQCGINLPTMDMVDTKDPRLTAAVWSWEPSYPRDAHGNCAILKEHGIQNTACDNTLTGFACRNKTDWSIANVSGQWQEGETVCQKTLGAAWHFAMPINGNEMYFLKEITGVNNIWLNYARNSQGVWQSNLPF